MSTSQRFKKGICLFSIASFLLVLPVASCNKLVAVPNPITSVTTNQVFSSDATATAAINGIYSYMSSVSSFSNSLTTVNLGESADELTDELSGNEIYDFFLINNLTTQTGGQAALSAIWQPAYFDIYSANAIILGLQSSTGVSYATRNQLTGEAKFIRAFCYFYLANIFGNVPLVLSTNFNQTVLLSNSTQAKLYNQIVSDLLDAQNLMISDFSLSGGMPIRANKWAATALLARVYQYLGEWKSADSAANAVISSGKFQLSTDLNSVFLATSSEAILQLQTVNNFPYATQEGFYFVPFDNSRQPREWLTTQLLNAFETGDLRRAAWVDSSYDGAYWYYYPYKYKILAGQYPPWNTYPPENYVLLRLGEQYLIRAEAETMSGSQQNVPLAITDINMIRSRAGLPAYSGVVSQDSVLAAVQQEYRVEFFAEWGHRWLDLRRWGIALETLKAISYKSPHIDSTQLLYPIPPTEIQTDPNLKQNPGYSGY